MPIFRNGNKIASAHTEKETKKATIRLLRYMYIFFKVYQNGKDCNKICLKRKSTPTKLLQCLVQGRQEGGNLGEKVQEAGEERTRSRIPKVIGTRKN